MDSTHGSKNLLQRAILYRHKELYLRREDWSFKPCETMCIFKSGFLDFLKIGQFVWARGFCGTRICWSVSVDCSGTIGKIHVVEIEVAQGQRMHAIMTDFMIWRHLTRPRGPFGAPGTALTRNVEDHMARRTCFREQYYTGTRRYNIAGEDSRP